MRHDNDNNTGIRFLSVCSGIEAASVAWHPLGWCAVAFSEIEKFPSAVLAHHYPDVPNLGDFTKIDTTTLGRVDVLAGGTPCQAFSVAGLRQSLADARGNLSLEFVRLAHELADRNGLRNAVWENVVGVLSTKDNAFGCFLAGLVGADSAIEPPRRGKWPGAGMVSGPKGRAAWRVLDAQYFGVAQRRRRVIVVADFGNGADPAAVLFEQDGLRRHSPPSRETGKDVAPTISARTKGGGGLGTDFDLDGGLIRTFGIQGNMIGRHDSAGPAGSGFSDDISFTLTKTDIHGVAYAPEIARCVATREGSSQDYETTTMVAVSTLDGQDVARTLSARHDGSPCADRGPNIIAQSVAIRGRDGGATAELGGEVATALRSSQGGGDKPHVLAAVAIDMRQASRGEKMTNNRAEGSSGGAPGTGIGDDGDPSPTVSTSHPPAVAHPIPFDTTQMTSAANRSSPKPGDPCHPLAAGAHPPAIASDWAVRRLTPVECARLQGFPDDYLSQVVHNGKPLADGPMYKGLGNSWPVNSVRWIGRRIQMVEEIAAELDAANDNHKRSDGNSLAA